MKPYVQEAKFPKQSKKVEWKVAWGFDNKFPCMIEKVCLCQNNGSIKPKHRAQTKKGRKHKIHIQVPIQFDAGAYTV